MTGPQQGSEGWSLLMVMKFKILKRFKVLENGSSFDEFQGCFPDNQFFKERISKNWTDFSNILEFGISNFQIEWSHPANEGNVWGRPLSSLDIIKLLHKSGVDRAELSEWWLKFLKTLQKISVFGREFPNNQYATKNFKQDGKIENYS